MSGTVPLPQEWMYWKTILLSIVQSSMSQSPHINRKGMSLHNALATCPICRSLRHSHSLNWPRWGSLIEALLEDVWPNKDDAQQSARGTKRNGDGGAQVKATEPVVADKPPLDVVDVVVRSFHREGALGCTYDLWTCELQIDFFRVCPGMATTHGI